MEDRRRRRSYRRSRIVAHKDPWARAHEFVSRCIYTYVSRSRCKSDRGQTRSRVPIPVSDPSSPRRPCVAAGSRGPRDHESCRPLSRGSDSSNQLSLSLSSPLASHSFTLLHSIASPFSRFHDGSLFPPYHFSLLLPSLFPFFPLLAIRSVLHRPVFVTWTLMSL